jgi:protein-tyrosine phosphatase
MKILMVCLGNICRSPLAEGAMRRLAKERGLDWEIESAGTGDWFVGKRPDRRSIRTARRYGINIRRQVGRQFKVSDFDHFDMIFAMDNGNRRDILRLARNDADIEKVKLLLHDKIVPDPRGEKEMFEPVFKLILEGCKEIINPYGSSQSRSRPKPRISIWISLRSYFQGRLKSSTRGY